MSPQLKSPVRYVISRGPVIGVLLWFVADVFVARGKVYGLVPSNFPAPLTGPVWWVWALTMLVAGVVMMLVIETIREQ